VETLQLTADLKELSFAAALARLSRTKATGALEILDAIGTNRAFLLNGIPQGAKLSRLKHPIGRILTTSGLLTEAQLNEALAMHNKTEKLLGQVLLELRLVSPEALRQAMETQSRQNLLTMFALTQGQMEFHEGLVYLTDFTPTPCPPLAILYEGTRDHTPAAILQPFLATLTFASVRLSEAAAPLVAELPPAEQMALQLLLQAHFTGELARAVPLPPKALGALLYALHELGGLELGPALNVARS